MIYTDSRYATGSIDYINDSRLNVNQLSVYRVFPKATYKFLTYTWTSEDRIDLISSEFLGSPSLWWKIMDINPELTNPFTIAPGTVVRIPSA
jgi:nucleoid-associated protein YgaU